jgi:division protein CdvB (Snf7/Vps24/ESCRT-III family)
MNVGDNALKKEAPVAKQKVQQLIEMRKQLEFRLKEAQSQIKKYYDPYYKSIPIY